MKLFILALLMPFCSLSSQEHEERINATIWWVNDVLYIEGGGHLYYALDVRHSINCHHDCCNDVEERIKEKIMETADLLFPYLIYEECTDPDFFFLLGKYEAYWECLHLIQHQGS